MEEQDGRLEQAEARYRAAVAAFPWGQSGPLALARLLSRTNRETKSRAVVGRMLDQGASRPITLDVTGKSLEAAPGRLQRCAGNLAVSRLLVAACLAIAVAQATPPRFQAGVEVVRVNVLVTDDNRPVAGLTAEDFELRDSSVVQQVESATFADIPVSMSLVLDISQSVRGRTLEQLKEAAGAALDQLAARDRAALLTFHSAVDLQADWAPPSSAIRTALHQAEAGGGTALYDAVFSALTMTGARRAIASWSSCSATAPTRQAGFRRRRFSSGHDAPSRWSTL